MSQIKYLKRVERLALDLDVLQVDHTTTELELLGVEIPQEHAQGAVEHLGCKLWGLRVERINAGMQRENEGLERHAYVNEASVDVLTIDSNIVAVQIFHPLTPATFACAEKKRKREEKKGGWMVSMSPVHLYL